MKVRRLDATEIDAFQQLGYLILPGFLPARLLEPLRREVDRWIDGGHRHASIAHCKAGRVEAPPLMELELGEHGWLISHPPLMAVLEQLMGPGFVFHHLHSARHDPGCPGRSWHQDYELHPLGDPAATMVHVLYYLNGLDGTIGDLVLLPGSHVPITANHELSHLETARLAGEVVLDDLPCGSAVIIHSALVHARRSKPGVDSLPRYFIDCSYCQARGCWPVAKPYWREMLARARVLGLDRGHWLGLFAEEYFLRGLDPVSPDREPVTGHGRSSP